MNPETFFDNFGMLADVPDGVSKLRGLILQLAVQGKLVPQDENDEPASVLLEKIKAEKEKLVKEKKIKKVKRLPDLEEGDLPYVLPDGWLWTQLDQIVNSVHYGYTASANHELKDIRLLRITDIQNGRVNWDNVPGCEIDETKVENYRLYEGDLLIARTGGTIGKSYLVEKPKVCSVFASYIIRVIPNSQLFPDYLKIFLESSLYWKQLYEKSMGTGQPNVNSTSLRTLILPLPPLQEQHRIVAKVDQLMALCDELEARQQKKKEARLHLNSAALDKLLTAHEPAEFANHWQRICDNFDLLYDNPETVGELRKAILQLAVQGRLVRQDENDEPAAVLLEKIKAEKERLVKEGEIKKYKNLPPIDQNWIPFKLPKGWIWARFPEIGEFGRGKSKHRPRNDPILYKEGKYPLVQTGDVARANGIIKTHTNLYNEVGLKQSRLWPKGTLCITIAANIADSAILGCDACFPDSIVGFIPNPEIQYPKYFEYFMKTAKENLETFAPSTAQKNINLGILEKVLIPLPPLAELSRIVARVDQLTTLCDDLESKLNQSQTDGGRLMEAVVHKLVAA